MPASVAGWPVATPLARPVVAAAAVAVGVDAEEAAKARPGAPAGTLVTVLPTATERATVAATTAAPVLPEKTTAAAAGEIIALAVGPAATMRAKNGAAAVGAMENLVVLVPPANAVKRAMVNFVASGDREGDELAGVEQTHPKPSRADEKNAVLAV